jgi:hypothetical protein
MRPHIQESRAATQRLAAPFSSALPLLPLHQYLYVVSALLSQGSTRLAIEVDGTETPSELAALKALNPVVVLLNIKQGVSRLHASRHVFEHIQREGITAPVVHHITFPAGAVRWAGERAVSGVAEVVAWSGDCRKHCMTNAWTGC